VIITNNHVIEKCDKLRTTISFIEHGREDQLKDDLSGIAVEHIEIEIPLDNQYVVRHPNSEVDLCVISIGTATSVLIGEGQMRHVFLNEGWFPSPDIQSHLTPIERIVMVGYPTGIWDQENNLPVIRNGLTATHPLVRMNGLDQFAIDAACFPGSSGSPVFLYEDGWVRVGGNSYSPGSRACLLGVLWGGPQMTVQGTMKAMPINTGGDFIPQINTMLNLGYVISYRSIVEIIDHLHKIAEGD